jgi:hypothetical protein
MAVYKRPCSGAKAGYCVGNGIVIFHDLRKTGKIKHPLYVFITVGQA